MESKDVKIVAIVGMCGSGKSTAIEYLTERGIPKVYFGGVILNAIKEAGEEITPETEKKFREGLREKEGKDFVVKRVVESTKKLIEAGQKRIVLDGLYSWTEYKILRKEFPNEMTVVAIVLPKALRRKRLAEHHGHLLSVIAAPPGADDSDGRLFRIREMPAEEQTVRPVREIHKLLREAGVLPADEAQLSAASCSEIRIHRPCAGKADHPRQSYRGRGAFLQRRAGGTHSRRGRRLRTSYAHRP